MSLYVGIDLGTSGCRACAIDDSGQSVAITSQDWPAPHHSNEHSEQDPLIWWETVLSVLEQLLEKIPANNVRAIAVDGTSSTLLITDHKGNPLGPALMYDDSRSHEEADFLAHCLHEECTPDPVPPQQTACLSASSSLSKLLYLYKRNKHARYALHQADWISGQLSGHFGISDENNCLKLGYDPVNRCWPDWLDKTGIPLALFPEPKIPGSEIGTACKTITNKLGLPVGTKIIAGTTDSTAAFLATGANKTGEAVSSLGSTLVIKVISEQPVFAPEYGVYSHRLGDQWLIGGASNTGGAVLLKYFSLEQLEEMTPELKPEQPTGLDYYPLLKVGERFPNNDRSLEPQLTPRPDSDLLFFQGMLEGMAKIEADGYQLLEKLGAPYPIRIFSVGGGAVNTAWKKIRENLLGIPLVTSRHQDAAYGAALLACKKLVFNK